jgi:YfiH family protein
MAEDQTMSIKPLLSPALQGAGVRHAFFTRQGGVSKGIYASLNGGIGSDDDTADVAQNRARMAQTMGVMPGDLVSLYQIHSPTCLVVNAPWAADQRPQADAMVTRKKGVALGIGTADCGPVLFADPMMQVIGAAHAGWKGAKGGVLEATIAQMEALGARRERIIAVLGPMLSQTNYEVGPEFLANFMAEDKANLRFFIEGEKPGHPHFDLPGYISMRLARAGVGTIEDLAFCTYADPERFYSYRRKTHTGEADYGRLISAIVV